MNISTVITGAIEVLITFVVAYMLFSWIVVNGKLTPQKNTALWLGMGFVSMIAISGVFISVASIGWVGGMPLVLVLGFTLFQGFYYNPFHKKV